MQYIDEKFKEESPVKTVENITNILKSIGIELEEIWHDSGVENCWSLHCRPKGMIYPTSNGKGITKEFARASAYGEFIERLQSGLFFYKHQSIERDEAMNLHTYAPDKKYMTEQELIENGEWMDYLIDTYGNGLTRQKIAKQCRMYACTEDDAFLTLPYYSLFEDKYVYLPAGFVEHMYSANGCCVGNTKAEAWIHALAEIMERRGSIATLTGGEAAAEVPESVLDRFPTVSKILKEIRSHENLDVKVFDFSQGFGIPVICTRIINKDTQQYLVNTGADPILEIAIQRTLTEILQGKNIERITNSGSSTILRQISDIPIAHNVLNLLERGYGSFAVDFFAEEVSCTKSYTGHPDYSGKTNRELLAIILDYYRSLNKPVYIRNYSFLNFQCYKFVIPGFSESRAFRLTEPIQEYALADVAARVFRQPTKASIQELAILPSFYKMIQTINSRPNNLGRLAGIPIEQKLGTTFIFPTLSYAAYRLGNYKEAIRYIQLFLKNNHITPQKRKYFNCIKMYLQFTVDKVSPDKIRVILNKFFDEETVRQFYDSIGEGKTPFDAHLLNCDPAHCDTCQYRDRCAYTGCKELLAAAGARYSAFTGGQSKENFSY